MWKYGPRNFLLKRELKHYRHSPEPRSYIYASSCILLSFGTPEVIWTPEVLKVSGWHTDGPVFGEWNITTRGRNSHSYMIPLDSLTEEKLTEAIIKIYEEIKAICKESIDFKFYFSEHI